MADLTSTPAAGDGARLAGLSTATVSYVSSGHRSDSSRISDHTRQRVLPAVRSLDHRPDRTGWTSRRRLAGGAVFLPEVVGRLLPGAPPSSRCDTHRAGLVQRRSAKRLP